MNPVLLAALLLASAQAPLGSTLVAVALPAIADGLGSDAVHATTLLVASYLVVTVLFQGPGGRLSDAIGHARSLWIGIGLFGIGSALAVISPTVWVLALARAVTAVGGALVVPSTMALLRQLARPGSRGSIFGTFGSVMALSAALGPAIGGIIVEQIGWRAVFLVSFPFLILACVLLRLFPLPAPGRASAGHRAEGLRSLDVAGLAMLLAASEGASPRGPEGRPCCRPRRGRGCGAAARQGPGGAPRGLRRPARRSPPHVSPARRARSLQRRLGRWHHAPCAAGVRCSPRRGGAPARAGSPDRMRS